MFAQYDIKIKRGESFTKDIIFDKPLMLVDRVAQAQIRKNKEDNVKIADFSCRVVQASGLVQISLTGEQTLAMEVGTYEYDVFLLGAGYRQCIIGGKFIVDGRATFYDTSAIVESSDVNTNSSSNESNNGAYGEDNPDTTIIESEGE